MENKAVLIILDGYGLANAGEGNAVSVANTPNLDKLFSSNPCSTLSASGMDVGLPEGQMGNSEVGHTNIGAGRVVFQILPKITHEIETGKFFENEVYIKAMDDAKNNGKALHIMGLLSDGGVHSHINHISAHWIWPRPAALRRSMSTASWTDVTLLPRAAQALSR